jgi:hypothetical protein
LLVVKGRLAKAPEISDCTSLMLSTSAKFVLLFTGRLF